MKLPPCYPLVASFFDGLHYKLCREMVRDKKQVWRGAERSSFPTTTPDQSWGS